MAELPPNNQGSPVGAGGTDAFQSLVLDIAMTFINLPLDRIDEAVHAALGQMAIFFQADRAYVFDYDFAAGITSNTHEWCAGGIEPQLDLLQQVPLAGIPDWVGAHLRGECFLVADVSRLPAGPLRELLASQDIRSLLTAPIQCDDTVIGFVGFDAVLDYRDYGENERHLLTLFANLLANVTQRKRSADALRQQSEALQRTNARLERIAHFDTLTDLPNRNLLADRLQQAMVQSHRHKASIAIAYLDLDGFKEINDRYGHDVGDRLLRALAKQMGGALRAGDTLARLGGDEFVAVLLDQAASPQSCDPILTRLLEASSSIVTIDGHTLQVSASIGVTFYPQQQEIDADQLLRQADQAMYLSKVEGKNRFHVFDTAFHRAQEGQNRRLDEIRDALRNEEFLLFYQPKVNMRTGEVVGAEALVRWQHPQQGLLSPAAFLPLIETHTLSLALGSWVIDTALAQITSWRQAGLRLPVSVNVSASQLQQQSFVQDLQARLGAYPDVPADLLELEITETRALDDIDHASAVMAACDAMGVRFALDDFGTGYSSMMYLKRLPARTLKIDRSFVRDMLVDADDMAILQGILGLASAFRREVLAEGVETEAHGVKLLDLGCELAQGFGIASPMPGGEVADWVACWQPPASWLRGKEA